MFIVVVERSALDDYYGKRRRYPPKADTRRARSKSPLCARSGRLQNLLCMAEEVGDHRSKESWPRKGAAKVRIVLPSTKG